MPITHLSDVLGLLLKNGAPTDAWDSSEYNEALYLTQIQFTINNELVTITNFNSPGAIRKFAEFLAATINAQLSVQGFYDLAEETGQQHIVAAALEATTQSATKRYFLWTSDLSGLQEWSGELFMSNVVLGANLGQVVSFSATLQVSGQFSKQAVP